MKNNINPGVAALIIVVVVAVVGTILWSVYRGPSAKAASTPEAAAAIRQQHEAGNGPTPEALAHIREYQRTHPGASSSIH